MRCHFRPATAFVAFMVAGAGLLQAAEQPLITPSRTATHGGTSEASAPDTAPPRAQAGAARKPANAAVRPRVVQAAPVPSRPASIDPRLVVFPYSPNHIYPIVSLLNNYTHIELAEGERHIGFIWPDKLLWTAKVSKTKRDIFIKPLLANNPVSATLITNLRRYQLSLSSVDKDSDGTWYQRVSWEVVDDDMDSASMDMMASSAFSEAEEVTAPPAGLSLPSAGQRVARSPACGQSRVQVGSLNFNYEVEGDAPFKPLMVFDDGRFTWFKFPPVQDMPPLFALNPSTGDAELETFIPCDGNFAVVQALLPGGALLKLGKAEVRIINNKTQRCSGFLGLFGSCN